MVSRYDRDEDERRFLPWFIGLGALLLVGGGTLTYGYFKGWFCQWEIGHDCPCKNATCIAYPPPNLTKDIVPLNSGAQTLGTIPFEDSFTEPCDKKLAEFSDRERPAQCIDVLYATSRNRIDDNYGNSFSKTNSFGSASVLVPFILPKTTIQKYCEQFEIFGISIDARYFPFFCVEDDTGQRYSNEDFETITEREYLLRRDELRKLGQKSDWIGLARVSPESSGNDERNHSLASGFLRGVNSNLAPQERSILLYIPGFNASFEDSVETAAHLAADLNFRENLDPKIARKMAVGLPIVYSWPTLETSIDWDISRQLFYYFESQLRADIAAKEFTNFLTELVTNTDVKNLNIIAYSMGNRVLLDSLPQIRRGLRNQSNEPVIVRIVHAAGDVGRSEYREIIENSPLNADSSDATVAIYHSGTDAVLQGSSYAQVYKAILYTQIYFSEDSLTSRLRRLRSELENISWLTAPIIEGILRVYEEREASIKNLVGQIGDAAEEFQFEDFCRLGGAFLSSCGPTTFNETGYTTIDATFIYPDFDFHGYFEKSPAVVSDVGCEFRGIRPGSPNRGVREIDGSRSLWLLDPKATVVDECITSEKLYVVKRKKPEPKTTKKRYTVYFPLLESDRIFKAPLPFGENGEGAENFLRSRARRYAGSVVSVEIHAYADTSGRESFNQSLSDARASFLSSFLVQNGIEQNRINATGLGEFPVQPSGSKGFRTPENRRAVITFVVTE